jgi:hypothetical protein
VARTFGFGSVQEFLDQESFLRGYANVTSGKFPLAEAIIEEIEAPFGGRGNADWFVAGARST